MRAIRGIIGLLGFGVMLFGMPLLIIFGICTADSLITTEYETVEVMIVDTQYRESYTKITVAGKAVIPKTMPPEYKVTVEYDGVRYTIDDKSSYEAYKNCIGQTISATLEIRTHENGQVWYKIVELD